MLQNPENGVVSLSGTIVGSTAMYTCNASFDLTGNTYRVCLRNMDNITGVWSGSAPLCTSE